MTLPDHCRELRSSISIIHHPNNSKRFSTVPTQSRKTLPTDKSVQEFQAANSLGFYDSLLHSCTNVKSLAEGKQIHAHMLINGSDQNAFLVTKLISMYAMCGSLVNARLVFDKNPKQSTLLWNAMIRAYVKNRLCEQALALYNQMQQAGTRPDKFTFPCVLKACADVSALQQGKEIHDYIITSGYETDVFVGNGVVNMYSKCGHVKMARHVFDKMSQRNMVTWNSMISGYTQNGSWEDALKLFRKMQLENVKPNAVTITSILPALAQLASLQLGKEIHDYVIRTEFEADTLMMNSLIDMYAKCVSIESAKHVFENMPARDVGSWNTMIACYAQNGYWIEALKLFHRMEQAGVKPDSVTIVSVLPACARLGALQIGKKIHNCVIRNGLDSHVAAGNALIDMYAKCQCISFARHVFDKMSSTDVVSWNVVIAGYSHNGHYDEALNLFRQMEQACLVPDSVTMATILPICSHLGALLQGKEIHNYIIRSGFDADVCIGNTLIDMYAKCGSLEFACHVFDKMSKRDLVSWSAMIAGYGMHGHGEEALRLFDQMEQAGVKPDHITFIAVLSACSHAGFVDEGWLYFNRMKRLYHVIPRLDHYACMVDLLGRAGQLDEAYNLIKTMPLEPDAGVLGALLGACRIHSNIELGEWVAEQLFELEPENVGYYVLLSNIYAVGGRWDGVAKIRTRMKERGLRKWPGCSWIEVNNRFHAFRAGDKSHPQTEKIYSLLESLAEQMAKEGYTSFVLHDME
eukprot:Gb_03571 [translate_table: standard]